MCAKILLAEDDPALQEIMRYNLQKEEHTVSVFDNGRTALDAFNQKEPDLLILDIMMPGIDGLSLMREVRKKSNVPIIMVTAKGEEIDKVVGFEIGADDYITKPFSIKEFVARVRAILRRMDMNNNENAKEEIVQSGNLKLDISRHETRLNNHEITLRSKEFDLLYYMMLNKGLALSRDTILERVWGFEYPGDTRTVDVHMRWLREKIEQNPQNPVRLLTIRGVGYKFSE
ncbi:MAG: response regulator transcription factor [Chloroflexi bacterium]|nr:response regulator transcription factor [Chloroflexota bacterium]